MQERRACQVAINLAKVVQSPRLISSAELALTQAQLESGGTQNALDTALIFAAIFGRSGERHSQWRVWLIAALGK